MLFALGILGWIVAIVAIVICRAIIHDNARAWKRLRDLVDIPAPGTSLEEAIASTLERDASSHRGLHAQNEALAGTNIEALTKVQSLTSKLNILEQKNAELRKVRDALRAAMESASRQCRNIEQSLVVVSVDAIPKRGTSLTHEPPNDGSPQFWGECGRRLHSFPSEELRDEWVRESPEFNRPLADKSAGGNRFGKELWQASPIVYHRPDVTDTPPATSEGTPT